MPLRVLLDEHIKPEIGHKLRDSLYYDVECVRDLGLKGTKDWELMPWLIRERRAICTRNEPDFQVEHRKCQDRGEAHFGVLVVGHDWEQIEIYWGLRQYLEEEAANPILTPLNAVIPLPHATAAFRERYAEEPLPFPVPYRKPSGTQGKGRSRRA